MTSAMIASLSRLVKIVSHYLSLKLYRKLGRKTTYLEIFLQFRQNNWMTTLVDLNNRLQNIVVNKLPEHFHKFIDSSAFGNAMESKLDRIKLDFKKTKVKYLRKAALITMKSFQFIGDLIATIS